MIVPTHETQVMGKEYFKMVLKFKPAYALKQVWVV